MTNHWGYKSNQNKPKVEPLYENNTQDPVAHIYISVSSNGILNGDMEVIPGYEKEAALVLLNLSKGILPAQLLKQQIEANAVVGLKIKKYIVELNRQNSEEPLIKPSEVFPRP
jgi:hypothetical protein